MARSRGASCSWCRRLLPVVALAAVAVLGGCVAYPADYYGYNYGYGYGYAPAPAYGYGYGYAAGPYVGFSVGGDHDRDHDHHWRH